MIVYNKKIKLKLGLNLTDFIRISGKYKKEHDNEIEIYNNYNELLYRGCCSKNKKNGRGKEYNEKGDLIFEGEYLNGKKWKGAKKIYDIINGELIFEYEYLNGKIVHIKEYDKYNQELLFSGDYINGERKGNGVEYKIIYEKINKRYKHAKIFSGEYLNGERKKGKEYNND